MKRERGITLLALMITVLVIIILSSIAVYSGVGMIRYAKFNKAKNEIQLMQANVNEWYREYNELETSEDKAAYIVQYGVGTTSPTCNQDSLDRTEQDTGIDASDYRFLSLTYLEENLGIDSGFEYLINIPDRKVILFGGLKYEGTTYYIPEHFDILNVNSVSIDSLIFSIAQGDNYDIVISDVKIVDSSENYSDISNFIVQYKKTSDVNWSNATNQIIKYTDVIDGKTKYKFSVQEGNYQVKITTMDKKLERTDSIIIQ